VRIVFAALLLAGCAVSPAQANPALPVGDRGLQSADLVFHESTSRQSAAIRAATGSRFTHVGLVFVRGGRTWVLEAVGPVKYTRFAAWARRGQDGEVQARRLRDGARLLTPQSAERLRVEAERHLGKRYDRLFEWTDRAMYCSELVWKAYARALDVRIGEPQRIGDLDLDAPAVRALVASRRARPDPDEPIVTPIAMMESDALVAIDLR